MCTQTRQHAHIAGENLTGTNNIDIVNKFETQSFWKNTVLPPELSVVFSSTMKLVAQLYLFKENRFEVVLKFCHNLKMCIWLCIKQIFCLSYKLNRHQISHRVKSVFLICKCAVTSVSLKLLDLKAHTQTQNTGQQLVTAVELAVCVER